MRKVILGLGFIICGVYALATWDEEGGSTQNISRTINEATTFVGSVTLPSGTSMITGAGSGSGLDSDKLDGQHGSYYATTASTNNSVNTGEENAYRVTVYNSTNSIKTVQNTFISSWTANRDSVLQSTTDIKNTQNLVIGSATVTASTLATLISSWTASRDSILQSTADIKNTQNLVIGSATVTASTLATLISSWTANRESLIIATAAVQTQINATNVSTGVIVAQFASTMTKISPMTSNTTTGYYGYFGSSNSVGIPAGGAAAPGGSTTVRKTLNFFVPGDAYVTTGIAYLGPIDCALTITSATASVTVDGKSPEGITALNFNIMRSSQTANGVFTSIFSSTNSLTLVAHSSFTSTTAFSQTKILPNDVLRLDIGDVGATRAGGSPLCVSVYGTQD